MLRVPAAAALVLAVALAAGVAIAGAAKPKPDPCKGPKAKCPSSIAYIVTVSYHGTETTRVRENAPDRSMRVHTIKWSVRTPQPIQLYPIGDPALGNVGFSAVGSGQFTDT